MANTRRELKPYKGYPITKINNHIYVSYDSRHGRIECNSLTGLKKRLDGIIGVNKLARDLGRLLLPQ